MRKNTKIGYILIYTIVTLGRHRAILFISLGGFNIDEIFPLSIANELIHEISPEMQILDSRRHNCPIKSQLPEKYSYWAI
jgi:hypothetical protein